MIVKFRNKIILGIVLVFLSFLLLGYGSVLYKGSLNNVFRVLRDINSSIIPLDYVHLFKDEVGTKASQLGFLVNRRIHIPKGFLIRKEVHDYYKEHKGISDVVWRKMIKQIQILEEKTGFSFNDEENPLLVSVRSAPPETMPGILATVLNVGVNDKTVKGLVEKGGLYFGYDTYRRFIEGFVKVVFRDRVKEDFFVDLQNNFLEKRDKKNLEKLDGEEMEELVRIYQQELKTQKDIVVPQDVYEQLKMSIEAVFSSWDLLSAQNFRELNGISDGLAMEVLIQRMVFGNLGTNSGTGVAYIYQRESGWEIDEKKSSFFMQQQGVDIMTPNSINVDLLPIGGGKNIISKIGEELIPVIERNYKFPQVVEFTMENHKIYILQVMPAGSLLYEHYFLLNYSFDSPEDSVSLVKEQNRKINEKQWDVYRNVYVNIQGDLYQSRETGISEEIYQFINLKDKFPFYKFGKGFVRGTLCLNLDEVEKVYAEGGAPILISTHREDEVIKAMMEGKIAGLITTYGNKVMHEALIAEAYLIPGIVINVDVNLDKGEVSFDSTVLTAGDDIIIGERNFILKILNSELNSDDILFDSYNDYEEFLDLDFKKIFADVEEEYRNFSYEALIKEHYNLWEEVFTKIGYYLSRDYKYNKSFLEKQLFLNLKIHFLHEVIFERGKEMGKSETEIEKDIRRISFDTERSKGEFMVYKIGQHFYEFADIDSISALGSRNYGDDGVYEAGVLSLDSDDTSFFKDRYFLYINWQLYSPVDNSGGNPSAFLDFAKRKLEERDVENYLLYTKLKVFLFEHDFDGVREVNSDKALSFPKEKLDEVLELLEEWEKKSN